MYQYLNQHFIQSLPYFCYFIEHVFSLLQYKSNIPLMYPFIKSSSEIATNDMAPITKVQTVGVRSAGC